MNQLIFFIELFFQICIIIVAVRAFLPWVRHNRFDPMFYWIYSLTDPVLAPIKRGLPPMKVGIDVSPFIVIVLLFLLQNIVVSAVAFFFAKFFGNTPGTYFVLQIAA